MRLDGKGVAVSLIIAAVAGGIRSFSFSVSEYFRNEEEETPIESLSIYIYCTAAIDP